ncbi:hypothetical protein GCM10027566_00400 [Arachidicoccus ginsenosidivorans]|uniref:hypothetical protein n=1 Tax=Arachidicoccus ginsenosidivorans TaxID=496057 RepID=UPI0013156918|nr:hypothetical protein [Arachidicoccus ginsenosidivorans]
MYSAEWKGREEGIEKRNLEVVEQLIENRGFSLEQISELLKLPLHQIEEIKANMEHTIP